ncbi:MAG: 4-hydroxythreonine-4-phosphate dehydrogenase PdxA [Planctomycetota bacterium]
MKKIIAITLGDPFGIGPEITAKALARPDIRRLGAFRLYGSRDLFRAACRRAGIRFPENIPMTDIGGGGVLPARRGPTRAGGAVSIRALDAAVADIRRGAARALVTAPVSKEALHRAGFAFPGHTEFLKSRLGAREVVMTFIGGGLRVALVTIHEPLARVPSLVTTGKVLATLRVFNDGLRRMFRVRRPRIAVAGLNPHAGEGGLFGNEESRKILPAIRRARRAGISVEGPFPADTLFFTAREGRFDGVVAMYHDQGLIPVKLLAFDSGVNVTMGLPIVRTSPDHGTAFDIAGTGRANPGSMMAAIRLAAGQEKC